MFCDHAVSISDKAWCPVTLLCTSGILKGFLAEFAD